MLEYGIDDIGRDCSRAEPSPELIIVPGIEVAPYYYWTGSIVERTLTMHNAQRNLLAFGLTKPEDYRSLPVSGTQGPIPLIGEGL